MARSVIPAMEIAGGPLECAFIPEEHYLPALVMARTVMPVRSTHFYLSPNTPAPLANLADYVAEAFNQELNTIVLKHYDNEDGYVSKAYSPHVDPQIYAGKIITMSLSGGARLFVSDGERIHSVDSTPGRALAMPAAAEHWVTPPFPASDRWMVFFWL